MSCGVFESDTSITSSNFPMKEVWSSKFDFAVYKLGVADDWIVVGQSTSLTAIDTESGQTLWKMDIILDLDSLLPISDDLLITASKNQLLVVDKTGQTVSTIDFDPKRGSVEIVGAYSHFVVVKRVPPYTLEIYDIESEKMIWEVQIDRGGESINFDPVTNTVYITSSRFVGAFDAVDGNSLWKKSTVARTAILDSGVLFYHWENEGGKMGYISAIDAQSSNLLWEIEMPFEIQDHIYDLSICDNYLVANTNFGMIVFDNKDGNELWRFNTTEFHYSNPVCMDKTLYARGYSTSKIFTFSLDGGYYLGVLNLGSPSLFDVSHPEYELVYKSGEFLIFPYENTVYAYHP
jgi:outer membrane protein assembly factor BamB